MKYIHKHSGAWLALPGLGSLAGPAAASVVPTIPEPGILSLLGAAGILVAVIAIRKRRK